MTQAQVIYVLIILFCIIMSGYFSATETAFSSLNRTRIRTLVEKGNKKAKRVNKLADNYDALISTILIGNNIVNILAASLGTMLFVELLNDESLGATVSTAVITVVVLIFGEITPKSIAKDNPESFAMFSSPLISSLVVLFTPLNFIFSLIQFDSLMLFSAELPIGYNYIAIANCLRRTQQEYTETHLLPTHCVPQSSLQSSVLCPEKGCKALLLISTTLLPYCSVTV